MAEMTEEILDRTTEYWAERIRVTIQSEEPDRYRKELRDKTLQETITTRGQALALEEHSLWEAMKANPPMVQDGEELVPMTKDGIQSLLAEMMHSRLSSRTTRSEEILTDYGWIPNPEEEEEQTPYGDLPGDEELEEAYWAEIMKEYYAEENETQTDSE